MMALVVWIPYFNPNAVEDDGSCEYPIDCSGLTSVLVEVTDGSWPSEVSWELEIFLAVLGQQVLV